MTGNCQQIHFKKVLIWDKMQDINMKIVKITYLRLWNIDRQECLSLYFLETVHFKGVAGIM